MTELQKIQIENLRLQGLGYIKVAQTLGLSVNTVKSYCRRNNLSGKVGTCNSEGVFVCKHCGNITQQKQGIKERTFCSNTCRQKYWSANQSEINRKTASEHSCIMCGKTFIDYARNDRKYCSRSCYITARYKGGDIHE